MSAQQFEEGLGIDETGDLWFFLLRAGVRRRSLRVMMGENDSGFVGRGFEEFAEPAELFGSEFSLHRIDLAQRVQQDEIRVRSFEKGAMFVNERRVSGGFCEHLPEYLPVVVIAEGEV